MPKKITLMDVTIRDGSYAVEFQYSLETIKKIIQGLSASGVEMIEAGHGLGLGADKIGFAQVAKEEVVLHEAQTLKGNSQIGLIGGPPITKKEEIQKLAHYLDFFRLACNVDNPWPLEDYIKFCKKLGFKKILVQMMRSSAVSVKDVVKSAKLLKKFGADVVYIVDTAGAFSPDQVEEYVTKVRKKVGLPVGFHGHNNLMMAVANSLAAAKAGCEYLDGSLKGIGRGPGNAPIEILNLVLLQNNYETKVNPEKLLQVADDVIKPIVDRFKKPAWHAAYFAYYKRDFFQISLLEAVCKLLDIDLWDAIKAFGEMSGVTEVDFRCLDKLIKNKNGDPQNIYAELGMFNPC